MVEKIEDKTKYAVKAFSKEAAYSEENGKECLIKEIEIMRNLQNPHNMKLEEVFESEHSLYIIF
jgi:calcium-dependent protein kinase